MPQAPRLLCADCARPMKQTRWSLPQGQAVCQPCRRQSDQRQGAPCPECGVRMAKHAKGLKRCLACAQAPRRCVACDVPMPARQKSRSVTTCSRWCGHFVRYSYWPQTKLIWCACGTASTPYGVTRCECAKRPSARSWPRCRVFIADCVVCNRVFTSPHTRLTCSSECAELRNRDHKRRARDRRRATERRAYVADVYRAKIYARDKNRCQLCGKKMRMTAVVPHPLAPTIDHIVPLSRGGTHEPANVHAAHFICNSLKSNNGGGEQLLLIG